MLFAITFDHKIQAELAILRQLYRHDCHDVLQHLGRERKVQQFQSQGNLDCSVSGRNNFGMEISGKIQNGVVVLDDPLALPEGTAVTVTIRSMPVIRVSQNQKRVEFPLIHSASPGSVHLTNERIHEILEEEDIAALKDVWNEPS